MKPENSRSGRSDQLVSRIEGHGGLDLVLAAIGDVVFPQRGVLLEQGIPGQGRDVRLRVTFQQRQVADVLGPVAIGKSVLGPAVGVGDGRRADFDPAGVLVGVLDFGQVAVDIFEFVAGTDLGVRQYAIAAVQRDAML
jgi:hypothetical protein